MPLSSLEVVENFYQLPNTVLKTQLSDSLALRLSGSQALGSLRFSGVLFAALIASALSSLFVYE